MPYLCGICLRGFAEDEQGAARFLSALENWIARGLAWYLPDSYLCVLLDGTIRLLPPRWKGDRSKHWCSDGNPF